MSPLLMLVLASGPARAEEPSPDERLVVLVGALEGPDPKAAADSLAAFLLAQPPRPAWRNAYRAATASASPASVAALRLQQVRALSRSPATLPMGRGLAGQLLAQNPGDPDVERVVGELRLRGGDADGAHALASKLEGGPAAELDAMALLALGSDADAITRSPGDVPPLCGPSGGTLDCAKALEARGWPEVALARLDRGAEDKARPAAERAALAEAEVDVQGDLGMQDAALASLTSAARLDPDQPAYARALVVALLDRYRLAAAAKAASSPDLARMVSAYRAVQDLNPTDTSEATAEAFRAAAALDLSTLPVVRAVAHHDIAAGAPRDALTVLAGPLAQHPSDIDLVRLGAWASSQAGDLDGALAILRKGLSSTLDAGAWATLSGELGHYLVLDADRRKAAGDLAGAMARLRVAAAALPRDPDVLRALAGASWAAGETAGAEAAYVQLDHLGAARPEDLAAMARLLAAEGKAEEARAALARSGVHGEAAKTLDSNLLRQVQTRDARAAAANGDYQTAAKGYQALVDAHPDDPELLHGLGDALAALGRHAEAADAYERARQLAPEDAWLGLSEVRNLVALGEPELAEARLADVPASEDPGWAAARADVARSIARAEAASLAANGQIPEAMARYRALLAEGPDPALLADLAELYRAHGQLSAACAFYDEAVVLAPTDDALAIARVRVMLEAERFDPAEAAAVAMVKAAPTPAHLDLVAEVERAKAIADANRAEREGHAALADSILAAALVREREQPDLKVAQARMLLSRGQTEEAFSELRAVLAEHPAQPAALSAAAEAGFALDRPADVVALYEAAQAAAPAPWIARELQAARLMALLDKAKHAPSAAESRKLMDQARAEYGTNSARPWAAIGVAEMQLDHPEAAWAAFEVALHLEPNSTDAIRGEAGLRSMEGEPESARALLERGWAQTGDPRIGLDLARADARDGRSAAAARILATLRAEDSKEPSAAPLELLPLPSGRVIEPESPRPAPIPASELDAVQAEIDAHPGASWEVGAWVAGRTGDPGAAALSALGVPIAGEVALAPEILLQAEAVPLRVSDGVHSAVGVAPSLGIATGTATRLGASLRLGSSPLGPDLDPYLVWYAAVRGRVLPHFELSLETGRAPVTDSYASWFGSVDSNGLPFGAVHDTWAGAQASWWGRVKILGSLRLGETEGPNLAVDGWTQGWTSAWFPLTHAAHGSVEAGYEGQILTHDREVGSFESGAAGMFSPPLYLEALGHVRGRADAGDWTLCGSLAAGPQEARGSGSLQVQEGTTGAWRAEAEVLRALGRRWSVSAAWSQQGDFDGWMGYAGELLLVWGRSEGELATPSPVVGSSVHGVPMWVSVCPAAEETP